MGIKCRSTCPPLLLLFLISLRGTCTIHHLDSCSSAHSIPLRCAAATSCPAPPVDTLPPPKSHIQVMWEKIYRRHSWIGLREDTPCTSLYFNHEETLSGRLSRVLQRLSIYCRVGGSIFTSACQSVHEHDHDPHVAHVRRNKHTILGS